MAFKTVVQFRKLIKRNDAMARLPFVTIRRPANAYVSSSIRGDEYVGYMRFEIDKSSKRFRLKLDSDGDIHVVKKGNFCLPIEVVREILSIDITAHRFYLTPSLDGWFYASYSPTDMM